MNKTKSVTKQGVISLLELRGFKIDTEYSTEYDLILWPTKEYSIVAGLIYFDHVNIQHDKHAEITEKINFKSFDSKLFVETIEELIYSIEHDTDWVPTSEADEALYDTKQEKLEKMKEYFERCREKYK